MPDAIKDAIHHRNFIQQKNSKFLLELILNKMEALQKKNKTFQNKPGRA